jgi:hypothetical protein
MKLTVEQEMKLSELLFKVLDMGCWHERVSTRTDTNVANRYRPIVVTKCTCGDEHWGGDFKSHLEYTNPSLFTRSAFLDVWDAVFEEKEDLANSIFSGYYERHGIDFQHIASPHFQLEVLKWLASMDKDLKEKVGEVLK